MQWAEEVKPSLLVLARHGAHRIEGTQLGSQAENLVRLAPCHVLLVGTGGVRPEDIPWIEEDGVAGLPWAPEAEVRILRVPLIARPLARNTVERFARGHAIWRVTTGVMDENKQAMIEADEFDVETMMVMFTELRAKQIRAEAEGKEALSPEMRAFIEEAKAQGITRCPIRDIEEKLGKCPVDFRGVKPEEAKAAVEKLLQ